MLELALFTFLFKNNATYKDNNAIMKTQLKKC
jgi:hypothetical protein